MLEDRLLEVLPLLFLLLRLLDVLLLLLDDVLVESDDQLIEKLGVVQIDGRQLLLLLLLLRLRYLLLLLHMRRSLKERRQVVGRRGGSSARLVDWRQRWECEHTVVVVVGRGQLRGIIVGMSDDDVVVVVNVSG